MKTKLKFSAISMLLTAVSTLWLAACLSEGRTPNADAYPPNGVVLDKALNNVASYFAERLPEGAKIALIPFDTPTGRLSDYVFEELWTHFEDSAKFVMVDRRNLEKVEAEIRHQYSSGRVDDDAVVSLTRQYGAEILIYGQMTRIGSDYRITVYATDVEKASSSQRAFDILTDNRLTSLLNVSADEEVMRAVSIMARSVDQKTTITVGRISYADTQAVSNLSAWLKTTIVAGANKERGKFDVASESESADFAVSSRGLTVENPAGNSAIQAVITGTFSPIDSDAEVSIQLVSTSGNRVVLSSSRFIISALELQRRKLSLLPEKNKTIITKTEFEAKQKAVEPYSGKNNKWNFTVTPDVLDGIYYDGDYMTMRLYSEKDCYFRLIHVDVNGIAQVIYPVSPDDNNFIRAGETRRIPDNTRFRMNAPFGEEMILAAAYERQFKNEQITGVISEEKIISGLTVEADNRAKINPAVTAKYSYTILPK